MIFIFINLTLKVQNKRLLSLWRNREAGGGRERCALPITDHVPATDTLLGVNYSNYRKYCNAKPFLKDFPLASDPPDL